MRDMANAHPSYIGQDATPTVLQGLRKLLEVKLMAIQSEPNALGGILRFPLPFEPNQGGLTFRPPRN